MIRVIALLAILAISTGALAEPRLRSVDLRVPGALEQLHQTNPTHFEKIQKVLAGLEEQPARAEGDWLKVSFDARDVELSRHLIRTSNPPKQLLQFTLDDTRYILYVVRSDLDGTVQPIEKPAGK